MFPSWPEEPQKAVNVLCEGPSVLEIRKADLLPGPIVAVNHALSLDGLQGLQVDLWATSDHPETLRQWSLPFRRPGLRYWTTDPNLHLWAIQEEIVSQGLLYSVDETVMEHLESGQMTVLPTLFPLLAWLQRVGTERIRLFGVDMEGSGSPIGHEPWVSEAECSTWNTVWGWRWGVERTLLAHSIRALRARGVVCERWRQGCSKPQSRRRR